MTVDWNPFMQSSCREPSPSSSFIGTPTYPRVAPADASPSAEDFSYTDAFDEGYLAETFGAQPDYSLDEWVVPDFYERPPASLASPVGFAPKNQAVINSSLPAAAATIQPIDSLWQTKPPFDPGNDFDSQAFPSNPLPFGGLGTVNTNANSPTRDDSPTPSLCGDSSQASYEPQTTSPATSTSPSLKREPPSDDTEEPEPKRVVRKRGRPRIHRIDSNPANQTYAESQKNCSSRRLPHNQVERKYREGLNSELERLRRAVPTLPQRDSSELTGPPKPSKATVLASAIDYIKYMEAEHERLAEENERLRGINPLPAEAKRARSKLQNMAWNKRRADSSSGAALNV